MCRYRQVVMMFNKNFVNFFLTRILGNILKQER